MPSALLTDIEINELRASCDAGINREKTRLISMAVSGTILTLIYPTWIILLSFIPMIITEYANIRAHKRVGSMISRGDPIKSSTRLFYCLTSWSESLCVAALFISLSIYEGQVAHFIPYLFLMCVSLYVATSAYQNTLLMYGHLAIYNVTLITVSTYDVLVTYPDTSNMIWAYFFSSILVIYFHSDSYRFFHNIHLEARAKSLEVEKARKHAVILTQQKSDLVSAIGHELRTPLNGILGFSQVIKRTKLTKKQREYVDLIESAGKDLHLLLSNVLDSEALEQGRLHLHTHDTNIPALLNRTLKIFEDAANDKGIYLKLEIEKAFPTYLQIDETRLGQCVNNLLSNAIRFTQTGGITVTAKFKNHKQSILSISVSDTGIGIPEDQTDTIFEKFVQGKNQNTSQNSTGLGLWLVKSIALAMKGSIELRHTSPSGSTFLLEFNLGHHALKTTNEKQHLKGLKVLHIEDTETNLLLVRATLDGTGVVLSETKTGNKAMVLLDNQEFDIIICDMHLPDCDGNQVLDYIRRLHNNNAKIPVIALTAQPEKIEQANRPHRFTTILSKPVDHAVLLSSLSTLSNDSYEISD